MDTGKWMLYNFVADSFHTKKIYSWLSLSEVRFYTENGRLALLSSLCGLMEQRTIQYVRYGIRLIGKRVVDFILALIELFARCYGWGDTSEYRLKIGVFAPTGPAWSKILGRRGCLSPKPSCHKTRVNVLSCGVGKLAQLSFVSSQITRLTDRRTGGWMDGRTDTFPLLRAGIPCSAVIGQNFDIIDPRIKIRGGLGEVPESEQSSVIVTQAVSIRCLISSSVW